MHSIRIDDETTEKVKALESRMGVKTMASVVKNAIDLALKVSDKTPGNALPGTYINFIVANVPSDIDGYPLLMSEDVDILPYPERTKQYMTYLKSGIGVDAAMLKMHALIQSGRLPKALEPAE